MICPTCHGTGQVPVTTVSVLTYGAKGDGVADDTAAIQRALDSYRPGTVLEFLASRVFRHTKVLDVTVPGTQIAGPGKLLAAMEGASALRIAAADVGVSNLTLTTPSTTRRWDTPAQAKVHLDRCTGARLTGVVIDGSGATGVFIQGASYYTLTDCRVSSTRADGIHNTGGSHHGTITRAVVNGSGDDGISVVSYLGEPICHDIVIASPTVKNQKGGRGLSVVGGTGIAITNAAVLHSWAAAIYIAAEKEWSTHGCTNVSVKGGILTESNTDTATDHGAVLIYNSQPDQPSTGITITDLTIKDTRTTTSRQTGLVQYDGGASTRVTMDRLTIIGGNKWLYSGNAPASATRRRGWTWNGAPVADVAGW